MKASKILEKVLTSAANVPFGDMRKLVAAFGFRLSRVKGSHHIFVHADVPELINLQEVRGKAKPYQVRQFLKLVEEYNLRLEDDGS
jgi:predicted RNA binding protein YcfA (HicA-like mRNA interferase family)